VYGHAWGNDCAYTVLYKDAICNNLARRTLVVCAIEKMKKGGLRVKAIQGYYI